MINSRIWIGIVFFCVLISVAGCVSMIFGPPETKSHEYKLITLPKSWQKIDPGNSDFAYQYPIDRSTISLNSVCGQYQELSLTELTNSLMLGLTDSHIDKTENLEIDGFPALRTTVSGKSSQEEVTVSYTAIRSQKCVYDFILVAKSTVFMEHRAVYENAVRDFHERADD